MKAVFLKLLFFGFVLFNTAYAESKYEYYKEHFEAIKTSAMRESAINTKILVRGKGFFRDDYDILFTSKLTPNQMEKFKTNAILICDKTYQVTSDIACGIDSVTGKGLQVTDFEKLKIYSLTSSTGTLIIIPESNFVLPAHKNTLRKFLTNLYKSQLNPSASNFAKYEYINNIYSNSVTKIVLLVALLLSVIGLARFIHNFKPAVKKSIFTILLADFITLIPVSLFVYTRESIPLALDSYASFITRLLDPFIFIQSLTTYSFMEIAVASMLYVFIILSFVLFVLPTVHGFVANSFTDLNVKNKDYSKYVLLLTWALTALVLITPAVKNPYLLFVLLILVFILNNIRSVDKKESKDSYKKIVIVTTLVALNVFFYLFVNVLNLIPGKTLKLFGGSSLLPTTFNEAAAVAIEPLYPASNSLVFADKYLIYHPSIKNIVNVPISKFTSTANHIIVLPDIEDSLFKIIHEDNELKYKLMTNNKTSYLTFNADSQKQYMLKLTFKCSKELASFDGNFKPFYFNSRLGEFVTDGARLPFMTFTGCTYIEGNEGTYSVPLTLPEDFMTGEIIMKFNFSVSDYVDDMTLFENNIEKDFDYINLTTVENVAYQIYTDYTQPVYVYSDISEEVKFSSNYLISQNINSLLSKGLINGHFTLWSDTFGASIKNTNK